VKARELGGIDVVAALVLGREYQLDLARFCHPAPTRLRWPAGNATGTNQYR
jgi:hypothetical protein